MSVRQPPIPVDLWRRNETHLLAALNLALSRLRFVSPLPAQENDLARNLYFLMLDAIKELDPDMEIFLGTFLQECNNQPDPDEDTRMSRENKRPDFQYFYRDNTAPAREAQKTFVIECKRLGFQASSRWVFNENYIVKGVKRFIDPEHGYALGSRSAAMIGFVQSMTLDAILTEVNGHAIGNGVTTITPNSTGWQEGAISSLEHSLSRSIKISPLQLRHLWVDLRPNTGAAASVHED